MFGFGSFAKGYFKHTLKRGNKSNKYKPPYWQHAYLPGRSRREAIAIIAPP